jgi:TraY domain-containing protein
VNEKKTGPTPDPTATPDVSRLPTSPGRGDSFAPPEFARRLEELLRRAPSPKVLEAWQRDFARVGRPMRQPKVTGQRVPLSLRVTPEMKARLDKAALKSGRSQSQEAEFRLERSFDHEGLLKEVLTLAYGERGARFLMRLGPVITAQGHEDGAS